MLEEAIPELWSAVRGWFTPAVLFLVVNIVIGTIAVTSKVAASASAERDGAGGENRRLSRVPSMALDRLRSFNLSRFAAPAPEHPVAGVLDLGYDQPMPPLEKEEEEVESEHEHEHEHEHAHMERSRSEAAAEAELPRLPARMRKSASEKSAFAHFEAEEDTDAVEARRPATTREAARGWAPVVDPEETEEAGGGEVDARADDFINKFRHQLKLQRIDSIIRYKETIRRGQAAAAGSE